MTVITGQMEETNYLSNYYRDKVPMNIYKSNTQLSPTTVVQPFNTRSYPLRSTYSILECLGHGTYGEVYRAKMNETGEIVSIKRMIDAFDTISHAKSALREIKILSNIKHKNIVTFYEILAPSSFNQFNDVYFVMEAMDMDLRWVIDNQSLSMNHVKYMSYQILCAINCLHQNGLIHRDLKPGNILVNKDSLTKICDLGLAREKKETMSLYVVSRWYRAPELLLECEYNEKIDIWAYGLIIYEMVGHTPLLRCNNVLAQLELIFSYFGIPSDVSFINNSSALQFVQSCYSKVKPKSISLFHNSQIDPLFLDLLSKCLQVDPRKRWNAYQLLHHPYFEDIFNEDDLYVQSCSDAIQLNIDSCNTKDIPLLKKQAYLEMLKYHPELLYTNRSQ
ncbi:hypothetical protein WA158_007407 [Blastocystis sp. Blastoise]